MRQIFDKQTSDEKLVTACLDGHESAFRIIYDRYRLPLFSYLYRLLPGRLELVKDLEQQTWIKAVRNFSNYDDRQKLLAWLCRIAHNLAMDFFRRAYNADMDEVPETMKSDIRDPGEELCKTEFQAMLEEAIESLPPEQRRVVELRREGIEFKEIAEMTRVSLNTALSRMHYAVKALRERLGDFL